MKNLTLNLMNLSGRIGLTGLVMFSSIACANTAEPLSVRVTIREAQVQAKNGVAGDNEGQAESEIRNCAVLLHGLARTSGSMNKLSVALNEAGWSTANVGYPSREFPIAVLAPAAVGQGVAACQNLGATRIDAVTHSLGGILMRQYLSNQPIEKFGRLVMLGPPNHGSEVVDNLGHVPGFAKFNGPAGLELSTRSDSVPNTLGPSSVDVGVIAGTTSINLVLSNFLPNPDDGKVSVASARLEGMCAMLTIPVSHPFLMKDKDAIGNVIAYLERGEFLATNENTPEYPACDHRLIQAEDKP